MGNARTENSLVLRCGRRKSELSVLWGRRLILYREVGSSEWLVHDDGRSPVRKTTVESLEAGTAYEFVVAARTAFGRSKFTKPVTATPL